MAVENLLGPFFGEKTIGEKQGCIGKEQLLFARILIQSTFFTNKSIMLTLILCHRVTFHVWV